MKFIITVDDENTYALTKEADGETGAVSAAEAFDLSQKIEFLAQRTLLMDTLSKVEHGKLYYNKAKHSLFLLAQIIEGEVYFKEADKEGRIIDDRLLEGKSFFQLNVRLAKNQPEESTDDEESSSPRC